MPYDKRSKRLTVPTASEPSMSSTNLTVVCCAIAYFHPWRGLTESQAILRINVRKRNFLAKKWLRERC